MIERLKNLGKWVLPGVPDQILLRIRWFGSGLLMAGYFTILYVSVPAGVIMTLTSDIICLPYALRKNYWDIVVIISMFSVINIVRLLTL
ncbi:hypothetical protein [Synechococcus phage S-B68]|nr:hypothetical protein [Synechococcus phage S-B68]